MRFLASLAIVGLLSVPAVAHAHTQMDSPPPRDVGQPGVDAHKTGPCGGLARAGTPTKYTPGQKVQVKFTETVDHRGCFQIAFSAANDTGFTLLTPTGAASPNIDDPTGDATPKQRTVEVTLPTTPCKACTLQVRQLMINQPCKANQQPGDTGAGDTYFSCADICIGTECDLPPTPDAGAGDAGSSGSTSSSSSSGSSGVDSGVSTKPAPTGSSSSTGGTPSLDSGKGDDGCNTSGSSGTEAALAAVVGVAIVAGLRRRRRG